MKIDFSKWRPLNVLKYFKGPYIKVSKVPRIQVPKSPKKPNDIVTKYLKTVKAPKHLKNLRHSGGTGVVLVSLLLTLNIFTPCSTVSIINFEQVNAGWEISSRIHARRCDGL